ncbi:MAG: hypothetical protein JWO22_3700 [Frankiales bacterium]|nr:hypothetical protein [Frankiales bacterium]
MRTTRVTLATAACACLLAACGSSLRVTGQPYGDSTLGGSSLGQDATTGSSPVGASTSGGTTAGGTGLVGATGGGATGSTGVTTIGGSSGGSSGTGGSGASGASGTAGASAAKVPVQVGIILYPDVSKAAAAFGGDAGNVGNQQQVTQTAVDWVNAHGGLDGHKVQLVVHNVSLTSTDTYSEEEHQACTDFGADHHAKVVMTVASSIDNDLPNCLKQYGIEYISGGVYLHDDTDFNGITNMIAPTEISTASVARAMVSEMTTRGYLKSGDTLGMLTEDAPAGLRTTNNVMIPALKAKGIKVVNYTIHGPDSTPDISNSAAAIQSAELKMASSGVKNVAFMCKGCFGLFMNYAESQSYYPRYFLDSLDGLSGGKGHAQSMKTAVGLSWMPLSDVGGFSHPKEFTGNPTRDLCHAIEKKWVTDDSSEFIAQEICGGFMDLYHASLQLHGAPVSIPNLMSGFGSFGSSWSSAANFGTRITPSRHYGAVGYRRAHYDAPCDCFLYDNHALHPFS